MSKHTAIEWTDHTWNPWYGCTKVSAGCDNCYMFREMRHYGRDPEQVTRSKTKFTEPVRWEREAAALGQRWLVFTCSWGDWFHVDADPWRDEAWEIVKRTPHITYQICTKRPGRIRRHLPSDWGGGYPNVWLMTSVENKDAAHRVRQLVESPAVVHALSCEPLIGPLDLRVVPGMADIEWVIAGGESDFNARPCELDWLRAIRHVCNLAGIPFFLKQLGGPPNNKRGGTEAVLDGRQWTEMPELARA